MKIAFDEAGNSGPNLLDASQYIYVLSAVNFSDEEAEELSRIFTTKSSELHFVKLRKRYDEQVLRFLNHKLITNSRVKYSLSEKRFELICKLVDNLIEPVFYEKGINLYQDGTHLTTANMIFIFSVTDTINEKIDLMLKLFQDLMRRKTEESIKNFYDHIQVISVGILDNPIFHALKLSRSHVKLMLESSNKYSIDPAYPAFTSLVNHWYHELKSRFDVIHDNSKQIEYWKELIEFFSDQGLHEHTELPIITGNSSIFPLPVNNLELADSKDHLKIQLADIIGSSLAYALNKRLNNSEDDFSREILSSKVNGLPDCHYLFPTFEVTPQEMGTLGKSNDETLNHLIKIISDNSEKYDDIDSRLD